MCGDMCGDMCTYMCMCDHTLESQVAQIAGCVTLCVNMCVDLSPRSSFLGYAVVSHTVPHGALMEVPHGHWDLVDL